MEAKAILYIRLTKTEIKSINLENKSDGGSSQTYIDIPKGQVSDTAMTAFFGEPANGLWKIDVFSLGYKNRHQTIEIYSRRETTNSIRNQTNNRVYSWKDGGFPITGEGYDEKENPAIVYFLKDYTDRIWAGWFYLKDFSDNWYLNIDLAKIVFSKERAGIIDLTSPVTFTTEDLHWPFTNLEAKEKKENSNDIKELQVIFYGAPGTGKSYTINKDTKDKATIRTTFHPDSDYSTFVGAYKPTTIEKPVMTIIGKNAEPVKNPDGTDRTEPEIVYDFVAQAFLKAYIESWKKYYRNPASPEQQYLIIEEINRGNCAQIFGDLFQLLDRNEYGFSDYPISADDDIRRYLKKEFTTFFDKEKPTPLIHADFNKMYNKGYGDVAQKIFDGEVMVFPKNFFIWATMNTSDQSLFPIDSAFKRRWEWKYVPITEGLLRDKEGNVIKDSKGNPKHLDWSISVGNIEYDWWSFISKVNENVIYKLTSSEDKELGYFFCKARDGIISAETFTDKVIFYLWNEVFKDAPIEELKCLKNEGDKEHPQLTFQSFYDEDDNGRIIINEKSLNIFLSNLGVTIKNGNTSSEETDEQTQDEEGESEDYEQ